MEKVISENWDLESLYPGGKNSTELHDVISNLKHDLKELQSNVQTFDQPELSEFFYLFSTRTDLFK